MKKKAKTIFLFDRKSSESFLGSIFLFDRKKKVFKIHVGLYGKDWLPVFKEHIFKIIHKTYMNRLQQYPNHLLIKEKTLFMDLNSLLLKRKKPAVGYK